MSKPKKKKEKECPHPNWWFDRTIGWCPYCEDEHMDSVCMDCQKTSCEIMRKNWGGNNDGL